MPPPGWMIVAVVQRCLTVSSLAQSTSVPDAIGCFRYRLFPVDIELQVGFNKYKASS